MALIMTSKITEGVNFRLCAADFRMQDMRNLQYLYEIGETQLDI